MHWKLELLLLLAWGDRPKTINLHGVVSGITINTSLIQCLYNPNEIYIYVTCKLFHTSNVKVPTEEVDVTLEALRENRSELCRFILFSLSFGTPVIYYRCFGLTH